MHFRSKRTRPSTGPSFFEVLSSKYLAKPVAHVSKSRNTEASQWCRTPTTLGRGYIRSLIELRISDRRKKALDIKFLQLERWQQTKLSVLLLNLLWLPRLHLLMGEIWIFGAVWVWVKSHPKRPQNPRKKKRLKSSRRRLLTLICRRALDFKHQLWVSWDPTRMVSAFVASYHAMC